MQSGMRKGDIPRDAIAKDLDASGRVRLLPFNPQRRRASMDFALVRNMPQQETVVHMDDLVVVRQLEKRVYILERAMPQDVWPCHGANACDRLAKEDSNQVRTAQCAFKEYARPFGLHSPTLKVEGKQRTITQASAKNVPDLVIGDDSARLNHGRITAPLVVERKNESALAGELPQILGVCKVQRERRLTEYMFSRL
jgi:hypothetical protein